MRRGLGKEEKEAGLPDGLERVAGNTARQRRRTARRRLGRARVLVERNRSGDSRVWRERGEGEELAAGIACGIRAPAAALCGGEEARLRLCFGVDRESCRGCRAREREKKK